jgi:predicted TIM-barrel fold metal-dependent hydrolase
MIIDFHTHVHPPREQARPFWQGRCPATIENVLALHDEVGLDVSVISSAGHYLRSHTREEALPLLQESNRYMASLRDAHPDKVVVLATAIPGGGDPHLRELERAVKQDDLRGVLISSSHRGAFPDDDDARAFFELAVSLDIPIMMHPPAVGFGEERMQDYRLASSVGRPFDNCLALARLIVRGIFEDFPGLKLVASHLGGGICEIIGRLDYAYELGDDAFFLGSYEPMRIKRKPGAYLKRVYMDTTSYHPPAIKCAIETVGAGHLVLGTDAPMLLKLKRPGLDAVRNLEIPDTDKAAIMGETARKLLKL